MSKLLQLTVIASLLSTCAVAAAADEPGGDRLPASASPRREVSGPRQHLTLNRKWKFLMQDVTGGQAPALNDAAWSPVNLPHSFSIPYFMREKVYNGYGWYRKEIEIPAEWSGRRISLEFEGVFIETELFVNGRKAGTHVGGYTGFEFDITPFVTAGKNSVAVRVNNLWKADVAPRAGDHQFSAGIYRDVYLNVTNKLHVAWCGTFVTTPTCSKESAVINAKTEVRNDYALDKRCRVTTTVFDPDGRQLLSAAAELTVKAGAVETLSQDLPELKNPRLWSPKTPSLYRALTRISDPDGKLLDACETTFGIRFFEWTADRGFFLNGEHLYLLGADVHQDRAGWGDAATNAGFGRDVKLMKDAGFNCIRGCHYPHDPAFVQACDRLGVIYFSENAFWGMGGGSGDRGNWGTPSSSCYPPQAKDQDHFDQSVLDQLAAMIRIHRNSPAIIAWSMSNEPFFTDGPTVPRMKALLVRATELARQQDPSRLVTIGGAQRAGIDKLGQNQVAFYNGDGATFKNPGVPSFVSEYGSYSSGRPGKFAPLWAELGNGWDHPVWRGGQAIWCGIDHGTVGGWGLATMGLVDYFRLPKRQYEWYRQAYGQGVRTPIEPAWPASGTPAKLKIEADRLVINSTDGTDDAQITVTVCDRNGKRISNNVPVTLKVVSGPGEFPTGRAITFMPPGNGDASDIQILDGQCAIDFRSYHAGTAVVEASSPGLEPARISLTINGFHPWVEGKTPAASERPYRRFKAADAAPAVSEMLLAGNRPCWVSSGKDKGAANDGSAATSWIPDAHDTGKWWKLDTEATYSFNRIQITFPKPAVYRYTIETSPDGSQWEQVIDQSANNEIVASQMHVGELGRDSRFVRIKFLSQAAGIAEIRVGGAARLPKKDGLLSGTVIGVNGSWEDNPKATRDAAFDFDPETFFDAPAGTSVPWLGLDLGSPATVTAIKFVPRQGLPERCRNGRFEGANKPDFSDAVTLAEITAKPKDGENTIKLKQAGKFRYLRFRSDKNGNGNIAEIEFYGSR
jgi:hypothetical protein